MQEFIRVPANNKSISHRKPIYGVGINDSDYMTHTTVNGKHVFCPIYKKWKSMIARCYSERYQSRKPTYIGCSVSDGWLLFSTFSKWHSKNFRSNWELDKDLMVRGNKIYSPGTCIYVPRCINLLMTGSKSKHGLLPGARFRSRSNSFECYVSIDSKPRYIGLFDTEQGANRAYVKAKNAEIMRKCDQYPEFAKYLINHLLINKD